MKIELRDLTKSYREGEGKLSILREVNYTFPSSGSVAVVGRSGIGKSTLLHLLGGLDKPTGGKILYDDSNIADLGDEALSEFRGKNIGFIFQFHHLLHEFDAQENVSLPLIIQGVSEEEARARADELLGKVGLTDRRSHRPGQLSGGEQQRVAIARALVTKPQVLLADEPTGNLDVATASEVQELLISMNRDLKNVLIVVTHNQELAQSMDIVAEMKPGGELQPLS